MDKVIIELKEIKREFIVGGETVHALRGVSFTIREGRVRYHHGYVRIGKIHFIEYFRVFGHASNGEYLLDGISVRSMNKPERAVLRNQKIGLCISEL